MLKSKVNCQLANTGLKKPACSWIWIPLVLLFRLTKKRTIRHFSKQFIKCTSFNIYTWILNLAFQLSDKQHVGFCVDTSIFHVFSKCESCFSQHSYLTAMEIGIISHQVSAYNVHMESLLNQQCIFDNGGILIWQLVEQWLYRQTPLGYRHLFQKRFKLIPHESPFFADLALDQGKSSSSPIITCPKHIQHVDV